MRFIWEEHLVPTRQWSLLVIDSKEGTCSPHWKILITRRADPNQRYVIPAKGGGIFGSNLETLMATAEALVRLGVL